MLEALKDFYRQFTFLNVKEIAQVVALAQLKSFKQGEVIVQAGELNYHIRLLRTVLWKVETGKLLRDDEMPERCVEFKLPK